MSGGLFDLYRDLHAHPELSFAEHRTAAIAAERARAAGYTVVEGVGGTGVVGVLTNGDGPTVLLRADMDGLPVAEATGLPYASAARGIDPDGNDVPVMHACGHDMHVTWLIGALDELSRTREAWSGTVLAVFQPAEELGIGAKAMLDDGLFDRFARPDIVLGQHVAPFSAGTVNYTTGPLMAGGDAMRIRLFGRGGHASRPETTVDPIVLAASTVLRLQTIVSREVPPLETAVVSIGSLHAGHKNNIIPAEAELQLTARHFEETIRQRVLAAIERIVKAEALAAGAPEEPEITITMSLPVLRNDPDASERTLAAIGAAVGEEQVHVIKPAVGSEDFGFYGARAGVPSVFWFTGGTDPELYAAAEAAGRLDEEIPSNHSPYYAPVLEPTVDTGVVALVSAAREWLK